MTEYKYDGCDQLESITYADGKKVSYKYDKNDNLTEVTDRTGAVTTYVYDAINRISEIHRPNGVSTYNTYNARDQIISLKNICDDCGWVISQYDYTYDDRGFIVGEDAIESLYGYAWDDKHDGRHENGRHDNLYPYGGQHTNKHDKDGKTRNGVVQESAEYTYNLANQLIAARLYDGKHYKDVEYTYDADGNRILQEEVKLLTRKVEFSFEYNLHTDDDWKGNSGNGNGNNKDNSGNGNHYGWGNGGSDNNGKGNGNSDDNGNTSTGGVNDNNGNANGNTNNSIKLQLDMRKPELEHLDYYETVFHRYSFQHLTGVKTSEKRIASAIQVMRFKEKFRRMGKSKLRKADGWKTIFVNNFI